MCYSVCRFWVLLWECMNWEYSFTLLSYQERFNRQHPLTRRVTMFFYHELFNKENWASFSSRYVLIHSWINRISASRCSTSHFGSSGVEGRRSKWCPPEKKREVREPWSIVCCGTKREWMMMIMMFIALVWIVGLCDSTKCRPLLLVSKG